MFVDKGYALKSSVEPVQFSANKPGGKLRVSLQSARQLFFFSSSVEYGNIFGRLSLKIIQFVMVELGTFYLALTSRTMLLQVKLEGSATQWGVRALASRRALLLNDFSALAVGAYLRACGFSASPKVRYTDTSTEQLWTLI